jgi:hypothetical protein
MARNPRAGEESEMEATQFPGPEPGDPEDVAWTLTTAGTMWSRGDLREAVRWLHRAAEAAGESGNDLRAVTLARAAADLRATLEIPPSVPPPPPAAPGARRPLPPAPSPLSAADQTSRMQAPPVSRPDNPPIQPMDDMAVNDADYTIPEGLSAVEPPRRPPPPPVRSRPPPSNSSTPSPTPAPVSGASARPSFRPPSVAPGPMSVRGRQALRVAVEPSPDDRNLLFARVLMEDEPVPAGAHEAILTALEPGAHLMSRKR